uniref:Uncharacterized protein LOC111101960 n=1 Tax=Crassostrea virginica TaxID=6565 RepID=A0A8B8AFQ9_CRAVI|nr:uncharacterized protein LOC111101960 [Crassostrea virginica]
METRPIKFLRIMTRKHSPRKDTMKTIIKMLVNLMKEIQLVPSGIPRQAEVEDLLTLLSSPVLQKSLSVTGVERCLHISCVTPDRVWVSDGNHLILTDTATDKTWKPQCVYCFPSSGDLLVGMSRYDTDSNTYTGKVMRYDNTSKYKQTIPHDDNTPQTLYGLPLFITENNNGDVLVSDRYRFAVVVTSGEGVHRFSYKGPPSGSRLVPVGICTDVMSHILVSDYSYPGTVQILDRDGQFLSYVLTRQTPGMDYEPYGLSYDVTTHAVWVGAGSLNNNTILELED